MVTAIKPYLCTGANPPKVHNINLYYYTTYVLHCNVIYELLFEGGILVHVQYKATSFTKQRSPCMTQRLYCNAVNMK